jgi:hypothetical protein
MWYDHATHSREVREMLFWPFQMEADPGHPAKRQRSGNTSGVAI